VLENNEYNATAKQLAILVEQWKKTHSRLHSSSSDLFGFIHSFNQIKWVTMRDEFLVRHSSPGDGDIFDAMDNLFSQLTHTDKSLEWSFLFLAVLMKTRMFGSIKATEEKIVSLAKVRSNSIDEQARFHIECFMFLLAMEGIYDEIIRFAYAIQQITDGKTVVAEDLQYAPIDKIEAGIRATPHALFDVWHEGHRVRNAIAHASFYYSPDDHRMDFIDTNPHDRTDVFTASMTLMQLSDMERRIATMENAFRNLLVLLQIYSDLVIPPEKHYEWHDMHST
jgi:hypothetical protein